MNEKVSKNILFLYKLFASSNDFGSEFVVYSKRFSAYYGVAVYGFGFKFQSRSQSMA